VFLRCPEEAPLRPGKDHTDQVPLQLRNGVLRVPPVGHNSRRGPSQHRHGERGKHQDGEPVDPEKKHGSAVSGLRGPRGGKQEAA